MSISPERKKERVKRGNLEIFAIMISFFFYWQVWMVFRWVPLAPSHVRCESESQKCEGTIAKEWYCIAPLPLHLSTWHSRLRNFALSPSPFCARGALYKDTFCYKNDVCGKRKTFVKIFSKAIIYLSIYFFVFVYFFVGGRGTGMDTVKNKFINTNY